MERNSETAEYERHEVADILTEEGNALEIWNEGR